MRLQPLPARPLPLLQVVGAAPTVPGLLHSLFGVAVPRLFLHIYSAAWFVGFFLAGLTYLLLMRSGLWLQPQEALVGAA